MHTERKPKRPFRSVDALTQPAAGFEYHPEQEFSPEQQQQLLASVLELFEQEHNTRAQSAWLLHRNFPELAKTPAMQGRVLEFVKKKRIWLKTVLNPELRRNEGQYFFHALLAFRATCEDKSEDWPSGNIDGLAKEAAEDLLRYVVKMEFLDEFFWDGLAHHGLYMMEFPELRPVVRKTFSEAALVKGDTFDQSLDLRAKQPVSSLFEVELKTFRRVWKAFKGQDPGPAGEGDLAQVHDMLKNAERVFYRPPHLQVDLVLFYSRCLSLLSAERLEFSKDGIVPVQKLQLRVSPPLPERSELD